jgi:hypothetical protein
MKAMYVFWILVVTCAFAPLNAIGETSNDNLEGKWNVRTVGVPNDYQNSVIDISREGNIYKIDIQFVDVRYRILSQTFTFQEGKLVGNVIVDGENVSISIWEEDGKVKGTATNQYLGSVNMTFTRPPADNSNR